jgi:tetratricopeptide (TPR) repeat protein
LRKRLLEQASKFYTKFAEERKNDPSVRAELAAALGRLGKIRAAIDLKSEGLGLYQQALDLYKALNAEKPGDRNIEASLTGTYFEMGVLYRGTKDEAQAVAFGQQAVNGWTALACLEPDNETYQAELARSWNGLGATFAEFKKYDAAREPLNQALSIRRMLVDTHPDTETTLRDLAVTYANVAWVAENRDDFRGAEEAYKEALAIAEPLYKRNSDRTLYRDDVARYFLNLGVLYSNNADPKLAADSFTQAAENWTELVRTHPKVKQFRYSAAKSERLVAGSEFRLSMNKEPQDYESKAKRALKRARDQITILLQEEPDNPDYVAEAALIDIVDGDQLRDRRSNSEAVEAYRRAIQSFSGLLQKRDDPINKRSLANGLLQLGVCLQRIEQPSDGRAARIAEALKSLTQSSVIWKELVTNDPQNYRTRRIAVECLVEVARLTIEEGDPQAALLAANDAVKIGEPMRNDSRFGSRERLVLQRAYWRQAQALTASGKYDDALAAWDAALQLEEGNDRKTSFFNIYRLATLACTPKFADAVKQAETYRREFGRNGYGLYELARIGALAARTAGGNSTDDKTQSGQFAVVAVLDLVNSRKLMGDNDPKVRAALAADRDWAALRTNRDWDALRQRDDFRKLLGEVFAGRTMP